MINRRKLLLGGAAAGATVVAAPLAVRAAVRQQSWRQPVSEEVVAWLRANAMPLATIEPGGSAQDIEFLRAAVGDARILSLGEATHGTHEFVQLKSRVIQYAVAELGFTVIAVENNFGEMLPVNDYVLTGNGSAGQAVAGMELWLWTTEEFAALVEWVRAWNVTHERKVKFYGIDMQGSGLEARHLLDYLTRVAPDLAAASAAPFALLRSKAWDPVTDSAKAATLAQLKGILAAFDAERALWISRSSETEWHLARHSAIVVTQCVSCPPLFYPYYTWRDRCMAGNVGALLDIEGPQAKALVCAHNGHVQRTPWLAGTLSMGHFLHEQFGARQVVIGFSFNKGRCNTGIDKIISFRPAPAGFFDAALARTDLPHLALDFRRVPASGPVADWMASKPLWRGAGGGSYSKPRWYEPRYWIHKFHPDFADRGDPRENFDLVMFAETSTPTRQLRAGSGEALLSKASDREASKTARSASPT